MSRHKVNRLVGRFYRQLVLLFMAGAILFPLYFIVITSLKSNQSYFMDKKVMPSINSVVDNFLVVFARKNFLIWFMNSFIVTIASISVGTIVASFAAYALSRMDFKGKHTIYNIIISLMVIPPVVMIVPLYILMARFGLINTYFAVIIIYVGIILPFTIFLLTNFFVTIPNAIIDSALIDGCSSFTIFTNIILPLSKPALVTVTVVNAFWVWNELLIALTFLQSDSLRTLMVGVTLFKMRYTLNVPLIFAGMLVAALPMIILYLISQNYFVKGITTGSVKE